MPELAALLDKAKRRASSELKCARLSSKPMPPASSDCESAIRSGRTIIAAGLLPIIEPEVDIHCPERAKAEEFLKAAILEELDELPAHQSVMLKLTLPEQDDFYADCVRHPSVLRVVALSGGYTRREANDRLRRNYGVVASFSRALVEGLSAQQSDTEFDALLDRSIHSIFEASNT